MPDYFINREEAGRRLAAELGRFKDAQPVVLALPRGGVPVGFEVAQALAAPLDIVLVRKIGVPSQPELALAAVVDGPEPETVVNRELMALLRVPQDYLEQEKGRQLKEIERRRKIYIGDRPRAPIADHTAIVVDDGIATGATMRAALSALRKAGPRRLVLAVPVAAAETIESFRAEVDEVVCLTTPAGLGAIGFYYGDFHQVSDVEVVALLDRAAAPAAAVVPRWEHFPHDADIGVRGIGPSRESAFEQAALAMTGVITDPAGVAGREPVAIACRAPDDELLLVEWLNALVYEMATRRMLFGAFAVRIKDGQLTGEARGEPVDVARHEPAAEVKGATLTELEVAEQPDGSWRAQCVVDV